MAESAPSGTELINAREVISLNIGLKRKPSGLRCINFGGVQYQDKPASASDKLTDPDEPHRPALAAHLAGTLSGGVP